MFVRCFKHCSSLPMLQSSRSIATTDFFKVQNLIPAQIYAQHNEVPRERNMESTLEEKPIQKMAWAVLSRAINGRSEVIKITDYEEADLAVQEHPDLFYKSGPFVLT